ncbi:hypothetical protein V6N12_046188 [Hibiscus sabdariffa]|uniref:Uncharacterized protein n=1 Tax=Hibiscus sabdariffa TaxID=183260 RepID=A0ABR2ANW2_9ROSI
MVQCSAGMDGNLQKETKHEKPRVEVNWGANSSFALLLIYLIGAIDLYSTGSLSVGMLLRSMKRNHSFPVVGKLILKLLQIPMTAGTSSRHQVSTSIEKEAKTHPRPSDDRPTKPLQNFPK